MMRAAGLARLLAPSDDGQVEFGDETVRERHAGQTGQSHSAFRFAHFDACAFRQGALAAAEYIKNKQNGLYSMKELLMDSAVGMK